MNITLPVLKDGSTGLLVSQAQAILNVKAGSNLLVDGAYGPQTADQVMVWQRGQGLPSVDGIVGDQTWASLITDEGGVAQSQ